MLHQPAFTMKAPDMYVELLNFKMEIANKLQADAYDCDDKEKVPVIRVG